MPGQCAEHCCPLVPLLCLLYTQEEGNGFLEIRRAQAERRDAACPEPIADRNLETVALGAQTSTTYHLCHTPGSCPSYLAGTLLSTRDCAKVK